MKVETRRTSRFDHDSERSADGRSEPQTLLPAPLQARCMAGQGKEGESGIKRIILISILREGK